MKIKLCKHKRKFSLGKHYPHCFPYFAVLVISSFNFIDFLLIIKVFWCSGMFHVPDYINGRSWMHWQRFPAQNTAFWSVIKTTSCHCRWIPCFWRNRKIRGWSNAAYNEEESMSEEKRLQFGIDFIENKNCNGVVMKSLWGAKGSLILSRFCRERALRLGQGTATTAR